MPTMGRYEILEKIAQGGMGEVFLAALQGAGGFQKRVALKLLLPELEQDPRSVALFLEEARVAATLDHPNVCQVLDVGTDGDRYYIAMELLDGQPLSRLLAAHRRRGSRMPTALAAYVIARAAAGLSFAHARRGGDGTALPVVHRDVSPSNLMLTTSGQVKLVDFGIARAADRRVRTETGQMRGKLMYMAPEQVAGREVDGRADVFSLGLVLFETLTGLSPHGDRGDVDIMRGLLNGELPQLPLERVPPAFREVVAAATEADPARRLSSARALQSQLDDLAKACDPQVGPDVITVELAELFGARDPPEAPEPERRRTVRSAPDTLHHRIRGRALRVAVPAVAAAAVLVAILLWRFLPTGSSDAASERIPAHRGVPWSAVEGPRAPAESNTRPGAAPPRAAQPSAAANRSGIARLDVTQAGTARVGAAQADAAQADAAQAGPAQADAAQADAAQAGAAQAGAAQAGAAQAGAAQADAAQAGAAQAGAAQAGPAQADAAQVGAAQAGTVQSDAVQAGGMQAGAARIGAAQAGTAATEAGWPNSAPASNPPRQSGSTRTTRRHPAKKVTTAALSDASERRGRLTLDTVPWTDVYLGNRKLGTTPLVEVEVPAGRQRLRAVNASLQLERIVEVSIEPGKTTAKRLSW